MKYKRKGYHVVGIRRKSIVAWGYVIILMILFCSGILSKNVYATEENKNKLQNSNLMTNEYIGLYVDESGRISAGTTAGNPENDNDNNAKLLYGYPYSSTSYTTFCIDGIAHQYVGCNRGFNVETGSHSSEGSVNGIHITQLVTFCRNNATGRKDIMEIKYTVENVSDTNKTVGCRIMLDTQLGNNDAAPFRVPGYGAITTETEFIGEDIPQLWQAFDSLSETSVIAQGRFFKKEEEKPDKVQFANWGRLNGTVWNLQINGNANGDSAVAVTWNEKEIAPGEVREYTTYYGLSEFTQDLTGPLILSVYSESELELSDNHYIPNPFSVNAYIENIGMDMVENVNVTLELPDIMF